MPSIEIICLGQQEPIQFNSLPFTIEAEKELISHRFPSLFQTEFDLLTGCIYHLRSPEIKGFYTAYYLMNREAEWAERIQFSPKFIPQLKALLQNLVSASPQKTIIFTSDYQCGPTSRRYFQKRTLNEFWNQHNQGKLWTNAMYYLS